MQGRYMSAGFNTHGNRNYYLIEMLTKCTKTINFFLNVFTGFSDKKNYILKRLFELATSSERDQDATTTPTRQQMAERIFKLSTIYVSVICQIP